MPKYHDNPVYIKDRKMRADLLDAKFALDFILSPNWIIFCNGNANNDFLSFLEQTAFKPDTPKNAEYEVLLCPIQTAQGCKISFWTRIWDTPENRRHFEEAMLLFYGKCLPKEWESSLPIRRELLRRLLCIKNGVLAFKEHE